MPRGGIRSRAFQCAARLGKNEINELKTMPVGVLKSTHNLIKHLYKRGYTHWEESMVVLESIIFEKERQQG